MRRKGREEKEGKGRACTRSNEWRIAAVSHKQRGSLASRPASIFSTITQVLRHVRVNCCQLMEGFSHVSAPGRCNSEARPIMGKRRPYDRTNVLRDCTVQSLAARAT